jgi:hypothetical protein
VGTEKQRVFFSLLDQQAPAQSSKGYYQRDRLAAVTNCYTSLPCSIQHNAANIEWSIWMLLIGQAGKKTPYSKINK